MGGGANWWKGGIGFHGNWLHDISLYDNPRFRFRKKRHALLIHYKAFAAAVDK